MLDTRLTLALDGDGLMVPDEGMIGLFHPGRNNDLAALPRDRCHVIHDFKPDFDLWQGRGFDAMRNPHERYAMVIVCLPRAKAQARALIAEAFAVSDGPVVIDGQKTDGVDGLLREIKKRVNVQGPISKAHGKLFWIQGNRF